MQDDRLSHRYGSLRHGHCRWVGFRDDDHFRGLLIEALSDLLVEPTAHIQRGRMDFIVMRYETNCAILHDIFQSIRTVLCKGRLLCKPSPEPLCSARHALVYILS